MAICVENKEDVTYAFSEILITLRCCDCSVLFAIPESLKVSLQKTQDIFYCPNGHRQHYSKSTADILREKLEKQEKEYQQRLQNQQNITDQVRRQRDSILKDRTVLKGKITKLKNRIAAGVCPCCNRTFQNLRRHVAHQHPEYINEIKT